MYQSLLCDASFFSLLLQIDESLATEARQAGCGCGGALHSAHYRRKPRGGPEGLDRECAIRFSFCCAVEGCRRRVTPPSLRFLGRKVFFGVLVLLVPVLRDGPSPERLRRLEEVFSISRRTILRWRRWWREVVPQSRFWQAARGRWARPLQTSSLPSSLLLAFGEISDETERVLCVLRFLTPLSGGINAQRHAL